MPSTSRQTEKMDSGKRRTIPTNAIILDIMLPGLDGLSALRQLRTEGNPTQILILSAKGEIDDRVKGLRDGADDYLTKPFALDELLARVEALCRRAYKEKDPILEVESLKIDTRSKTVACGDSLIDLTPREYAILEFLVLRRGYVVRRTEIEAHVYDDMTTPMSNVVDRAICSMRKKLEAAGNPTPVVQTKRGQGYNRRGPRRHDLDPPTTPLLAAERRHRPPHPPLAPAPGSPSATSSSMKSTPNSRTRDESFTIFVGAAT